MENFYRYRGIEPSTLPPPSTATGRTGAVAAPPASRTGLQGPAGPTGAMAGRLGRAIPDRMDASGRHAVGMQGTPLMQPFLPGGGSGGSRGVAGGPAGAAHGVGMLGAQAAQPLLSGSGGGGSGPAVVEHVEGDLELVRLLQAAGCVRHLERFRAEMLDEEVLLEMKREDFQRMGVTEVSQSVRQAGNLCVRQ